MQSTLPTPSRLYRILLTDGGFLPDGTFRHLLYFDTDKVEALFRAEVLRLLLKEEQDVDGWRRRRKLTWAKLIQKVYEIDPLLCRFCGTEMKIISFITEYPLIKKILTHIDFESQQPEPLAHSPPLFNQGQDTVYVPF